MLLFGELHTYLIITIQNKCAMKPIKKVPLAPLTEAQMRQISAEFDEERQKGVFEEMAKLGQDIDESDKVAEIVSDKSFVLFESDMISSINGAVVKPEYRRNISYTEYSEPFPNGEREAKGISIKIDSDAYLSDIFENSPYGIIKKNRTGVGATTLELKSPRNSIIVVPTRNLASTKAETNPEQYLYVGTLMRDGMPYPKIEAYIADETVEYKKILVVADSLKRVRDAIGDSVYSTYFLMVDEIDIYQSDSTFRPALEEVMDYYFKFGSHNRCLVSATIHNFCNPEINEEEVINIEYSQPKRRNLSLINTDNPHAIVKELIEKISVSHPKEKIFIAYNKVLFIRQIIENLSPELKEECGILCSEVSMEYAGHYFRRVTDNTLPSRINFATNPYFAGIDINERFHLISVSNVEFLYTLLSPDRYLQIAGRCRAKEGLHSETIVYNTKEYKGSLNADSYGRHLLEMAYDIVEYINQVNNLSGKYKSYDFWDESFVKEIKEDLLSRSERYYYRGTKMPLVRRNKITGEYVPAFFNVDSLYETLKLRIDLYTHQDNLFDTLKSNSDILSYTVQNRAYTESQVRSEAIVNEDYIIYEEEGLAFCINEIREIASISIRGFRYNEMEKLLRESKRRVKTFVECVKQLWDFIPIERLLNDLPFSYYNEITRRKYHNAAIFWALDDNHSFKRDMKVNFPEGGEFTTEQIKERLTPIYWQHFRKAITTNIYVEFLREFFSVSTGYVTIDGKKHRKYKIESHNPFDFEGEPLLRIPASEPAKKILKFSKR